MKRKLFFIIFVMVNLFFIFFHIHKQSQIIKLSYEKQKHEKQKTKLTEQKQSIMQALQEARNRLAIKAYALKELNMKPISLDQIKNTEKNHDIYAS